MTKYETNIILYLLPKVLFLGFGFKLLINIAGTNTPISIIIGTIIGLGINFILTKFIHRIHKFIILTYSAIFFIIGIILITQMIARIYLDLSSIWYILIPIILLIFYTLTKKEVTIYRVTSILVLFQIGIIFLAFASLIPTIQPTNLTNINDFETMNIITTSIIFAFLSTLPYTLLTDFKNQYRFGPYLISCFILFIFSILIIGILSSNVAVLFDYPEYVLFKSINVLGFLENIENILFGIWFIVYFPFLNIAAYNIKKIIRLKY